MREALQERVACAVRDCCRVPTHRDAAMAVLRRPGFALHPEAACRAGLFTLDVFRSIQGTVTGSALALAASVELQMEAANLLDNLADEGGGSDAVDDYALELALAITLLECGASTACQSFHNPGSHRKGIEAVREAHMACVEACGGQYLDATLASCDSASTDQALEMTCLKSGGLGRFAAGLGARAATKDSHLVSLFESLGFNAFTFAQLVDDLRDACHSGAPGDDLSNSKKTVPLAFFSNDRLSVTRTHERCTMTAEGPQTWNAYAHSAGHLFGAVVAEAFLARTKATLAHLKDQRCEVDHLEDFVRRLEGDFHAALAVH